MTEIPRTKPQIRTVPEYFVFGHDIPESLYETTLAETGRKRIAIMFGLIGDGRNLLATLMTIRAEQGMGKIDGDKQFHFTIVDHKPAVIARNMIILTMLGELAEATQRGGDSKTTKLVPTLYYVFLAPIMPPTLHTVLQIIIQKIIDVLEDKRAGPTFLDLPRAYRPDVLRVLREWQDEVGTHYPPSKLRPRIVSGRVIADSRDSQHIQKYMDIDGDDHRAPPGCKKQEAFYRKTAILTLSGNAIGHGKELQEAFDTFDPVTNARLPVVR